MHYFTRNIGDYHKKAGRLSILQHGAYTLLLDACYDRERFPTLEEAIDWTWAHSAEERKAVEFVLRKFFILEDGLYVQDRIREEIEAYRQKGITNKRIAVEREEKRRAEKNVSSTTRAHGVNDAPPNHKPITNNQEPLTNNQQPITNKNLKAADADASVCVDASQSSPPAKRVAKPKEESKGVQTWVAYSNAYYSRYGVDPVRNAKTNSMITQLVDRLGEDDAPHVAAFYIHHSNSFYVANGHSVGMLLRDAEKLRTEWATGRKVTQTMARQVDRTASNAFANMLTAQEQGNDRK